MRTLLAAAFVALAALPARADYVAQVLADSPVHFYRLSEDTGLGSTATDVVGTDNGTYLQCASGGTNCAQTDGPLAGTGDTGTAFSNPANNPFMAACTNAGGNDACNHASYLITTTGDYTIEHWVKFASAPGANCVPLSKSNGIVFEYATVIVATTATPRFVTWQTAGATHAVVTGATGMSTGVWHHFVATVDDGVAQKVFLDGVEDGSTTSFTGSITGSTQRVRVNGLDDGTADCAFDIANLALYTAVLSPARIRAHYQYGVQQIRRRRAALDNLGRPPVLALARDSALPWLTLAALRNMETAMEVHVEP